MKLSETRGIGRRNARWLIGAWLAVAVLIAGCSGGSKPATSKVHGKVTYKNQPVTEGTITFIPAKVGGGPSRPAVGNIKGDGTYELSSFGGADGAVPGDYVVTVDTRGEAPLENPTAPVVSKTPVKYTDPAQSGLKATIPAGKSGTLEFDFTLED